MAEAEGGEISGPARPQPVRMSLSEVKAGKEQKKMRLAHAMNTSTDFFSADSKLREAARETQRQTGGGSGSTPIRRSVSFSEDTSVCHSDPGRETETETERERGTALALSLEHVYNARGELQVDSDDDEDLYEDTETQVVLRASQSAWERQRGAERDRGSTEMMASASSASSLESPRDRSSAEEVGMIQADWMVGPDKHFHLSQALPHTKLISRCGTGRRGLAICAES